MDLNQVTKLMQRGFHLYEMKKYDLSLEELQKALAENPQHDGVLRTMAMCYRELKEGAKAMDAAKEALAVDPENPHTHYILGLLYLDKGEIYRSEKHFKQALKLDLEDADSHVALAAIYTARHQEGLARDHLDHALSLDPEHPLAFQIKSEMASRHLRPDDARDWLLRALQKEPEGALHHLSLGELEMNLGNRKKAVLHFKDALRLDPTDREAKLKYLEAKLAQNPPFGFFTSPHWWVNMMSETAQLTVAFLLALLLAGSVQGWEPGSGGYLIGRFLSAVIILPGLFYWCVRPILKMWIANTEWGSIPFDLKHKEDFATLNNMLAWLMLAGFWFQGSFLWIAAAMFISGYGIFGSLYFNMEEDRIKRIYGMVLAGIYASGAASLMMDFLLGSGARPLLLINLCGWVVLVVLYYGVDLIRAYQSIEEDEE